MQVELLDHLPPPATLYPFPRLVLPTRSPLFLPARSWRRRTLRPSQADLARRAYRGVRARFAPARLRLPIPLTFASRCWATDTARASHASERRSGGPTKSLPDTLDHRPVADLLG